jgi:hypothetical protein
MPITKRTLAIAASALAFTASAATLALTGGGVESAYADNSVEGATQVLQGKRLTVFLPYTETHPDVDHRIDFCSRGRALIKSTFYGTIALVRRSRARWRVVSAGVRPGVWWANVRFDPGGPTAKVVVDRRGVRFLGHRAEVTGSPRC